MPAACILCVDEERRVEILAALGMPNDEKAALSMLVETVLVSDGVYVWKNDEAASKESLRAAANAQFIAGIPLPGCEPPAVLLALDTRRRSLSNEQEATLVHLGGVAAESLRLVRQAKGSERRATFFQHYFERCLEGFWCYELEPPVPTDLPVAEQIRLTLERGRLTLCNDALARLYGYESAHTLTGTGAGSHVALEARRTALEACFASGYRRAGIETLEKDRHGKSLHFSCSIIAVVEDEHIRQVWGAQVDITERKIAEALIRKNEKMLGIVQDISRRERVERALRESEERWRRLIENHPEPLLLTVGAEIVYLNEAATDLFGAASANALAGRSLLDFVAPGLREVLRERAMAIEHGEAVETLEYEIIGLDGERRVVESRAVPIMYEGQRASQKIMRDVTQQRRYERQLIHAREQALEVARLKSAFLTNMSHEIRTPLTSIIGFAEILATESSEENKEFAQLIRHSGERLMATLNSVLDLAQLEGGTLRLAPERFDIVALAEQVLDLFRVQAQQGDITLHLEAPGAPAYVQLDSGAVSRILTNLISNAMKFTIRGQVTLEVELAGTGVKLRVTDTGIGIRKAFLAKLFNEFSQESGGLTRGYQGSGLGLAITKRLVELMNGTIEVESTKGQGSTFTVHLPRTLPRRLAPKPYRENAGG